MTMSKTLNDSTRAANAIEDLRRANAKAAVLLTHEIEALRAALGDKHIVEDTPIEMIQSMDSAIEAMHTALRCLKSGALKHGGRGEMAPRSPDDPTRQQGQFLAFISEYVKRSRAGVAPSHADLQRFFVSACYFEPLGGAIGVQFRPLCVGDIRECCDKTDHRKELSLGAALMMALTLAFVAETVPKARTGRAMGLLGTMSAIGTALGTSLGGVLIAVTCWQAIFLINLPAGILALFLLHRHLPADRRIEAVRPSFDAFGTPLLALTLAAYALAMTIGRGGFGMLNLVFLAIAAIGLGLFITSQTKAAMS